MSPPARVVPFAGLGDARASTRRVYPGAQGRSPPTAASSTFPTWASSRSRGPRRTELSSGCCFSTTRQNRAGIKRSTRCSPNERGGSSTTSSSTSSTIPLDCLIVNASNRDAPSASTNGRFPAPTSATSSDDYALLSPVQGRVRLERLGTPEASTVHVRRGGKSTASSDASIRTGYTGEPRRDVPARRRTPRSCGIRVPVRGAVPCGARGQGHVAPQGLLPAAPRRHQTVTRHDLRRLGSVLSALDTEFTGAEELRRIKSEDRRGSSCRSEMLVELKAVPQAGMSCRAGDEVTLRDALADARPRHRPRFTFRRVRGRADTDLSRRLSAAKCRGVPSGENDRSTDQSGVTRAGRPDATPPT